MAIDTCGRQIVVTAGTRVQVTPLAGAILARVDISALKRNTDDIYIGDQTVGAAADQEIGHVLEPGDVITLLSQQLADVWIDANVSGEGVMWMGYDNASDG